MEKVQLVETTLYGLSVRTNNRAEMTPDGKIGPLWQSFYGQLEEKGIMPSVGYGVYANYESDQHGDFDCIVAQKEVGILDKEVSVTVPAGTYLRFEKSGECPQACIELWGEVWEYFEKEDSPTRTFNVDYEEYLSKDRVAIYIGIEE